MANTEISLERIRNELRRCEENYGPAVIVPDERWEMHACVIRDAMVQMGLDPADKTTQEAFLLGTFLALGHIVNSPVVLGPAMPFTYIQCQIARKWIEGEMPAPTLSDTLALHAMEMMNRPDPCSFIYTYPNGRGSSACNKLEGHEPPHLVMVTEKNGDDVSITEIEVP